MESERRLSLAELHSALPSVLERSSFEDKLPGPVPTAFPSNRNPTAAASSRSPSSNRAPPPAASSSGGAFVKGIIGSIRSLSRNRGSAPTEERGRTAVPFPDTVEEPRGRATNLRDSPITGDRSASTNTVATASTGRSTSRGRAAAAVVHFGGRGGAGNIVRSPSRGRADQRDGAESVYTSADLDGLLEGDEPVDTVRAARELVKARSLSRGREEIVSSSRGGRGNMRSASRARTAEDIERERIEVAREREVEEQHRIANKGKIIMNGRGGRGNAGIKS